MQAVLMEGGLVKTILEIVADTANCLQAILKDGVLVKTILEIVCFHWCMRAPHGRWACEDNP